MRRGLVSIRWIAPAIFVAALNSGLVSVARAELIADLAVDVIDVSQLHRESETSHLGKGSQSSRFTYLTEQGGHYFFTWAKDKEWQ